MIPPHAPSCGGETQLNREDAATQIRRADPEGRGLNSVGKEPDEVGYAMNREQCDVLKELTTTT